MGHLCSASHLTQIKRYRTHSNEEYVPLEEPSEVYPQQISGRPGQGAEGVDPTGEGAQKATTDGEERHSHTLETAQEEA